MDGDETKRLEPPVRVSHRVDQWKMYRALKKLYNSSPQLRDPAYHARVRRYVRLGILLDRFLDAFADPSVPLLNEKGQLNDSYDLIRRYAETLTKLEKHLYSPVPRTEKQAKTLEQLRAEADAEDAADEVGEASEEPEEGAF